MCLFVLKKSVESLSTNARVNFKSSHHLKDFCYHRVWVYLLNIVYYTLLCRQWQLRGPCRDVLAILGINVLLLICIHLQLCAAGEKFRFLAIETAISAPFLRWRHKNDAIRKDLKNCKFLWGVWFWPQRGWGVIFGQGRGVKTRVPAMGTPLLPPPVPTCDA